MSISKLLETCLNNNNSDSLSEALMKNENEFSWAINGLRELGELSSNGSNELSSFDQIRERLKIIVRDHVVIFSGGLKVKSMIGAFIRSFNPDFFFNRLHEAKTEEDIRELIDYCELNGFKDKDGNSETNEAAIFTSAWLSAFQPERFIAWRLKRWNDFIALLDIDLKRQSWKQSKEYCIYESSRISRELISELQITDCPVDLMIINGLMAYEHYPPNININKTATDTRTKVLGAARNVQNTILYGPPGTGKTYTIQQDYINQSENSQLITFHQSYSYEDFVEGIKPDLNSNSGELNFKIVDGVFKEACEEAYRLAKELNPSNQQESLADFIENSTVEERAEFFNAVPAYTLCIDEINRGNVSAIFGELITLIEESKRLGESSEAVISLPYSHKLFGVPPNLQIIGTMNTADRSVEALDTALRRRFVFKEMMPKYEDYDFEGDRAFGTVNGIHMGHVLKVINQRIEVLLDRDHMIGHTYLLNKKSEQDIQDSFVNQIIPLLQDYFYNDYEKIKMVLGKSFFDENRLPLNLKSNITLEDIKRIL